MWGNKWGPTSLCMVNEMCGMWVCPLGAEPCFHPRPHTTQYPWFVNVTHWPPPFSNTPFTKKFSLTCRYYGPSSENQCFDSSFTTRGYRPISSDNLQLYPTVEIFQEIVIEVVIQPQLRATAAPPTAEIADCWGHVKGLSYLRTIQIIMRNRPTIVSA